MIHATAAPATAGFPGAGSLRDPGARHGDAFCTHGVWIVAREQLLDWLRTQHNAPVPFERLARFADRLPRPD